MRAFKTTYYFLSKAIIGLIGFWVLVIQPLSITVSFFSEEKSEICWVDLDNPESESQDFNEDYVFVNDVMRWNLVKSSTSSKITTNYKTYIPSGVTSVIKPPPKKA